MEQLSAEIMTATWKAVYNDDGEIYLDIKLFFFVFNQFFNIKKKKRAYYMKRNLENSMKQSKKSFKLNQDHKKI